MAVHTDFINQVEPLYKAMVLADISARAEAIDFTTPGNAPLPTPSKWDHDFTNLIESVYSLFEPLKNEFREMLGDRPEGTFNSHLRRFIEDIRPMFAYLKRAGPIRHDCKNDFDHVIIHDMPKPWGRWQQINALYMILGSLILHLEKKYSGSREAKPKHKASEAKRQALYLFYIKEVLKRSDKLYKYWYQWGRPDATTHANGNAKTYNTLLGHLEAVKMRVLSEKNLKNRQAIADRIQQDIKTLESNWIKKVPV